MYVHVVSLTVSSLCCKVNDVYFTSSLGVAPLTPVELSTLSPTAAATSSFMKSGMTLTQVLEYFFFNYFLYISYILVSVIRRVLMN